MDETRCTGDEVFHLAYLSSLVIIFYLRSLRIVPAGKTKNKTGAMPVLLFWDTWSDVSL
jgi:hypothetical protein